MRIRSAATVRLASKGTNCFASPQHQSFIYLNRTGAAQRSHRVAAQNSPEQHPISKIALVRCRTTIPSIRKFAREGTLHQFSAICVHLGCVVSWNATEKTWDCPCHGSRYTAFGQVVNGPANAGLEELKESTEEEQLRKICE
jgi:Rieske Fe-S protein